MSHISCTDTNRFRSVVCPSHCGITVSLIMHEHHLFPKSCVSTSHLSVSDRTCTPHGPIRFLRAVCTESHSLRTCTGTSRIYRAVCSSRCSLRTCRGTSRIHRNMCPSHCSLRTCTGTSRIYRAVCSSHCSLRTCTGTSIIHRAGCPSHCSLRTCMIHGLSRSSEPCVHLTVVSEHA